MNIKEKFMAYCECLETTKLYSEFSFYSLISSVLQRRIWTSKEDWKIFPNLYLIFVGDPGTGKTVASVVNSNIQVKLKTPSKQNPGVMLDAIKMAPDSVTVEQLICHMAEITDGFTTSDGRFHAQSAMTFVSEELGNLFKKQDENLVKFLVQGYDGRNFRKETRNQGKFTITNMCINLLGCINPDTIGNLLHSNILAEGFLGRALFIYGGRPEKRKAWFNPDIDQRTYIRHIEEYCKCLLTINGECNFSEEADKFFVNWYENDFKYLNPDKKLIHYYSRKKINVIKLAMVIKYSEDYHNNIIQTNHVEQALDALKRIEIDMHLALSSIAKNPVHILAHNILQFLKDRKNKLYTVRQIQLIFNDEGPFEDVNSALEYLFAAKKIKTELDPISKELCYNYLSDDGLEAI